MPKMKSNRAAKKRFKVTASGKIKRDHAYANHKFSSKSPSRKRDLRKSGIVHSTDMRRVRQMLVT